MQEQRENTSGDQTPGFEQPTITVADILRTGREKRGQDLRSVANILRIRYVFLEAIERGDFASLPGDTYAYGFVRTYAGYLNLNKDEIVRQFKHEVENYGDRKQLVFPTPVPESKTPGLAILLTSIVLLAIAYGGWTAISRFDVEIPDWVPFLAAEKTETTSQTTNEAENAAEASVSEPSSEEPVTPSVSDELVTPQVEASSVDAQPEVPAEEVTEASTPVVEEVANADVSTLAAAEEGTVQTNTGEVPEAPEVSVNVDGSTESSLANGNEAVENIGSQAVNTTTQDVGSTSEVASEAEVTIAAVTPPPPPEPEVFGDEGIASPISIHADRDTWMHIVNASGEAIFSRVLRAGSVYNVPQAEGLVMATGNAGGIVLKLNGQDLPKLGPLGAVRRDIILSEEGLLKSINQE